jgi:threonine aldolase
MIGAFAVDLSSDNASQPTDGMRRVMAGAAVGDEEHGEDPTVRRLEEAVADLMGKEAAVFLPSGTMANIVAYAVHCGPEHEILIHADSHPVYSGYGGPAVPGRALMRPLRVPASVIPGARIRETLAAPNRIRLLSLENTHNRGGGSVWPLAALESACAAARDSGVATHLDGARLLNAAAALGVPVQRCCAPLDSVWIDLSKGLGCPAGAVLAGSAAFVAEARRAKQRAGGVLHQAGILAAAGLYALEHHVDRLIEDHTRAAALARGLAELPGVALVHGRVETNIVYFDVAGTGLTAAGLLAALAPAGIRFKPISEYTLRAVTHLDIRREHVPQVLEAIATALADCEAPLTRT